MGPTTPMGGDEDARAFWQWFASAEGRIRVAFAEAVARKDYGTLEAMVGGIKEQVARVDARIDVRLNGGGAAFRLALSSSNADAQRSADRLLALAPAIPGWSFGRSIDSPPKNVIVRDGSGDELVVAYAEVTFVVLPPKPDGTRSILFAIPSEFDPKGPRGHLYHAAATEILKFTFGGPPAGLGTYALVPASWLEGQSARGVTELAAAW